MLRFIFSVLPLGGHPRSTPSIRWKYGSRGLFLDLPKRKLSAQVRSLPLPDFEPVTFGALFRGKPTPVIEAFLEAIQARARELTD